MDIVIVSQYLRDIENFDENNSRFVYLAKLLSEDLNNQVEIVTSDFNHATKKNFKSVGKLHNVKITALHEPGYPKNVCLKRFSSHRFLAKNIKKYLNNRKKPDICYCAVPSLAVADSVSKYCESNNVRFIVDVQDLWPEAFKMVFHVPVISNFVFYPMKKQADRIYSRADRIVAVSKTYADRAKCVNKKCENPTVVYLGTDKNVFDEYANRSGVRIENLENYRDSKNDSMSIISSIFTTQFVEEEVALSESNVTTSDDGPIRIAYCGTLGSSYDISCVIEAIKLLDENDKKKIQFIVMGDGPRKQEFIRQSEGLPIFFTGRLPYPDMVWVLSRCDIAVNPVRKDSAGSIINKVGDYAMAGLPVVNTQECEEYRDLLEQYNAGINCRCANKQDVADALKCLIDDRELRIAQGQGSLRMGMECFDRGITYNRLVELFQ